MRVFAVALCLVLIGLMIYQDCGPKAERCRDRGGNYYLDGGCVKFVSVHLPD